ncbi:phosphoribosyltransferase [Ferruginibacter lapsinanis]|uniref:phosphoribosyltransferase n=1 Tax=Ferruginibacter lapsinanis TaxID=563172 RepID=UPI001E43430D|nr:phosphoribosyltransferase [Ferruginibacter lapsinanis]UEG50318.1 phosphoribosyltransferase [Ferruginibacter lapsinanis]
MIVEKELHPISGTNIITFLKYYPQRYIVELPYSQNRQTIYQFKDGIYQPVLKLFTDCITGLKQGNPGFDFWVGVIPASKVNANKIRYESLCQNISNTCGVHNGYELLKPIGDRNQVHVGGHRDYTQVIPSINFGDVKGKDIILLDDVMTMGKSFTLIHQHLNQLGVRSVIGVMLGKTHWPEESVIF